jgi:hypothetical protein
MIYTDTKGNTWSINDARTMLTTSNGSRIFIDPSLPDESIGGLIEALINPAPIKSDAERIAELEAQVQLLISKISNP